MFCKQFKADLIICIWLLKNKYLIAVVLYGLFFVSFILSWNNYMSSFVKQSQITPTLGDLYFYLLGGCDPFVPGSDKVFVFPSQWILLILYICYLNLYDAYENLQGTGVQLLLRNKSRKKWWISKCLCVLVSVTLYIGIGTIVTSLLALFCGMDMELSVHVGDMQSILKVYSLQIQKSQSYFFADCILVVFLTIVGICLLQLLLSLVLKPILGFVFISIELLLSSYFMHPILIGNYLMLARSELYVVDGLPIEFGLVSSVILCIASVLCGTIYFNRMDIYGRGVAL